MKSAIYQILNKTNGKFYIGSAVDIFHRWQTHEWHLNRGSHQNKHLQASFNLYGYKVFEFQVLEYCDKSQLKNKEQFWIDWTKACEIGYNIRIDATSNIGIKRSKEAILKQIITNAGFRHSQISLERMRKVQSNRSSETKAKLSASRSGYVVSEETKNKIGIANSKPDKWPHKNGYKCKCDYCRAKLASEKFKWKMSKLNVEIQ